MKLSLSSILIALTSFTPAAQAALSCHDIFSVSGTHANVQAQAVIDQNILTYTEKLRVLQDQWYQWVRVQMDGVQKSILSGTSKYNEAQASRNRHGQVSSPAPVITYRFQKEFKSLVVRWQTQKSTSIRDQIFELVEREAYFKWLKQSYPNANFAQELYVLIRKSYFIPWDLILYQVRAKYDPGISGDMNIYINKTLLPILKKIDRIERLIYKLESENPFADGAWLYASSTDVLITKRQELIRSIYAVGAHQLSHKDYETKANSSGSPLSYEKTLLHLYFEKSEAERLSWTLDSINELIDLRMALRDLGNLRHYLEN